MDAGEQPCGEVSEAEKQRRREEARQRNRNKIMLRHTICDTAALNARTRNRSIACRFAWYWPLSVNAYDDLRGTGTVS